MQRVSSIPAHRRAARALEEQSRSQDAKTLLVALHDQKIPMLLALSTISGAVVQPAVLDPLSLVNNKALQATTLLPYRPPAENNGLSTATLALG